MKHADRQTDRQTDRRCGPYWWSRINAKRTYKS